MTSTLTEPMLNISWPGKHSRSIAGGWTDSSQPQKRSLAQGGGQGPGALFTDRETQGPEQSIMGPSPALRAKPDSARPQQASTRGHFTRSFAGFTAEEKC